MASSMTASVHQVHSSHLIKSMLSNSHDIINLQTTYGHYHLYQFYNYPQQSYHQYIFAYSLTEQLSDKLTLNVCGLLPPKVIH